jgi:hypothetical protein
LLRSFSSAEYLCARAWHHLTSMPLQGAKLIPRRVLLLLLPR